MNSLAYKIAGQNLSSIVQAEGVQLRRSGKSYKGRCPFHEDKTPSFTVKENRFKCFGCGASGDVIDFVRALRGLSFKDALAYLGIQVARPTTQAQRKEAQARIRELRRSRELVEAFRAWEGNYSTELGKRIRGVYRWIADNVKSPADLEGKKGDTLTGLYKELPLWEWGLEVLACGSDEEKYRLFKVVVKNDKV